MREEDKELGDMDVWKEKVQQDITDIKNNQSQFANEQRSVKSDIEQLKTKDKLQDVEISNIKAALGEIKDDTNFIRRKITSAIISGIVGLVITGVAGYALSFFSGGN